MFRWSAAFEQEVLRINDRFNLEIIEGNKICPYARGARQAGSSVREVCPIDEARVPAVIAVLEGLEARSEIEVAQVIFPLLPLDAGAFQEFASEVGRANAGRTAGRPLFVQAAFHPELEYSTATPHRLVPFFRRSPDPMIQFVRLSVLDGLHEGRARGTMFFDGSMADLQAMLSTRKESVTERITRENHAAAVAGALQVLAGIQDEIRADRAQAYRRFLEPSGGRSGPAVGP
jgi:hypothetical protein